MRKILLFLLLIPSIAFSQKIIIGGAPFFDKDRGILPPVMTGAQMNAIPSPQFGWTVANSDSGALCFYNGTLWIKLLPVAGGSGITTQQLADSMQVARGLFNGLASIEADLTFDSLLWRKSNGDYKIKSYSLTQGSNKVTVTKTARDSTLAHVIDVNEANLNLNNIGGTLGNLKIASVLTNKYIIERVQNNGASATITPNYDLYDQVVSTASNLTVNAPTGGDVPYDGKRLLFLLTATQGNTVFDGIYTVGTPNVTGSVSVYEFRYYTSSALWIQINSDAAGSGGGSITTQQLADSMQVARGLFNGLASIQLDLNRDSLAWRKPNGDIMIKSFGFDNSTEISFTKPPASNNDSNLVYQGALNANSIANSKLANVAPNTLKGSVAGGTPADLTAAQVAAMLPVSTTSTAGTLSAANHTKLFLFQTATRGTGTQTHDANAGGQDRWLLSAAGARTLAYSNLTSGYQNVFYFDNTSGGTVALTLPANSFVQNTTGIYVSTASVTVPVGKTTMSLALYDGSNFWFITSF